jgi:hypothetical protein
MPLPNNRRSVSVGNNVFENLYVYGDCEFDKDVTINGQLKYDELSLVRLTVTDKITAGIVTATTYYGDGSNITGIVSIPAGVIVMWSGSIASIPSGWVICNGSNETPDLRDKFIVGAGNNYSVGDTGGADSVTLTTDQIPSHSHVYSRAASPGGGQDQAGSGSGDAVNHSNQNTTSTGGGQAHENRPPYYALAYIMKT